MCAASHKVSCLGRAEVRAFDSGSFSPPFPAPYCLPIQMDPVQMEHDGEYSERIIGMKPRASYRILCTVPVLLLKHHFLNKPKLFSVL